eukprot:4783708-Amphidinium_carterae.2
MERSSNGVEIDGIASMSILQFKTYPSLIVEDRASGMSAQAEISLAKDGDTIAPAGARPGGWCIQNDMVAVTYLASVLEVLSIGVGLV